MVDEFSEVYDGLAEEDAVEQPTLDTSQMTDEEKEVLAQSRVMSLMDVKMPGQKSDVAPPFPYDVSPEAEARRKASFETPAPRSRAEEVRMGVQQAGGTSIGEEGADTERYVKEKVTGQTLELRRAPGFVTSTGEYVDFAGFAYGYDNATGKPLQGPDIDLQARYRIMDLNDASEYVLTNEDGTYALDQNGSVTTKPLLRTERYQSMVTPADEPVGVESIEFFKQAVMSGKGPRNLGELDDRLKKLGVNQTGRTYMLDAVKNGALDTERNAQGAVNFLGFLGEVPDLARQALTKILTFQLDAVDYVFGDGERTNDDLATIIENASDFFSYNIPNMEQILAQRHGLDVRVAQQLMQPQGMSERLEKLGPEYGGFYTGFTIYNAAKSMKTAAGFEGALMARFEADNIGQALQKAKDQGYDYHFLKMQYIDELVRNKRFQFRNLHERRIDNGIAMMMSNPRQREAMGLVKEEVSSIGKQIDNLNDELKLYTKAGNQAAIGRTNAKIDTLIERRRVLVEETLVPKTFKDTLKDFGLQTTVVAGGTEAYTQFFGNDPETTPFVELGLSVATSLSLIGTTTINNFSRTAWNNGKRGYSGAQQWANDNPGFETATPTEKLRMINNSKTLDKLEKKALRDIANAPPEFQRLFFAGAQESAAIRADLIKLSQMSGVKIDENAFINNLGDVSAMGGLITLARNLDEKIVVTGLDSSIPLLLRKETALNNQRMILTQMAESMQQLTRAITVSGNAATNHQTAFKLHQLLGQYIAQAEVQLAESETNLSRLMSVTAEEVKAIHFGGADARTGGLDSTNSIAQVFDYESRALKLGIDVPGLGEDVMSPPQRLIERAKRLDQLAETRSQMIKDAGTAITPEAAATGEASVHAAHNAVHISDYMFNKANQFYNDFEVAAEGSFADISQWGYDILDNPTLFKDTIPDTRGRRTLAIKEGKLTSTSKTPFNALLLDASERSVERMQKLMDEQAPGSYDELIGALRAKDGIEDDVALTALDEFKMLYRFSESDAGKRVLPGGMPLLIKAAEWKDVRQHISDLVGQNPGQQYYKDLKRAWDTVGDPQSDTAFRTGWMRLGEEPQVVGPQVFEKFRSAQSYWDENIVERYNSIGPIRKFSSMLTQERVKAMTAEGADRNTVLAQFNKYDTKDQPIFLLDNVLAEGIKLIKQRAKGVNQPLTGVELTKLLEEPLAKLSGGFRDRNGTWRIIVQDDMDPNSKLGTYGREMQRAVRLWLQGAILNTKQHADILAEDAKGLLKSDQLTDKKTIYTLLDSLENIQVYQRNADGSIVPYRSIPSQGQTNKFVHGSEVRQIEEAKNIAGLNAEAQKQVDQFSAEYTEYKKSVASKASVEIKAARDALKRDRNTAKDLGIDVDRDLGSYDRVGQMVYENVATGGIFGAEGFEQGLPRLKDRIKSSLAKNAKGMTEKEAVELADHFVARYTLQHIVQQSSEATGASLTVYSEKFGQNLVAPEIGINHVKMAELLAIGNPDKAAQIRSVINFDGVDRYGVLEAVVKVGARIATQNVPGVTGRVPTLSLDALLSRGYNINRQVVSPQYTALELILRQSRQSGARALQAMLNNPALARRILDKLETGAFEMPEQFFPDFKRAMTIEILKQESENEYRRSLYGDTVLRGSPGPAEPVDEFTSVVSRDVSAPPPPPEEVKEDKKIQPTGVKTIDQLRALGFQL